MGRDVRQNGISSGEITKIFQPELLDTGQLRRRADTQTLTPPRNGASILEVSSPYQLFFCFYCICSVVIHNNDDNDGRDKSFTY